MDAEQLVYARLSTDATLVGLVNRFYPTRTTENAANLPHVVYQVTPGQQELFCDGPSDLHEYGVTVTAYAVTLKECLTIMSAVKACLNGWRGGNVQWCRYDDQGTTQEDPGFSAYHVYTLFTKEANVQALVDSTGIIRTGQNYIELETCDNVLRLDCDGLSLNDEEVGGAPDLTNYALKNATNTFTAGQAINADSGTAALTLRANGANLLTLKNTGGSDVANVNQNGTAAFANYYALRSYADTRIAEDGACTVIGSGTLDTTVQAQVVCASSSRKAFVVKGHASQSANLQEWQDNNGNTLAYVDLVGSIYASNYMSAINVNCTTVSSSEVYSTDVYADNITGGDFISISSNLGLNVTNGSGSISLTSGNLVLSANNVYLSASTTVYLDAGALTSVDPTTGSISVSGGNINCGNTINCTTINADNFTFGQGSVGDVLQVGNILSCTYLCNNYFATTVLDLSDSSKVRVIHPMVAQANSDYVPFIVKGSSGQTEDLQRWTDDSDTVLAKINSNGHLKAGLVTIGSNNVGAEAGIPLVLSSGTGEVIYFDDGTGLLNCGVNPNTFEFFTGGKMTAASGFQPGSMDNATASNGTIYFSTTNNKLVFKDAGGTVHNLY